MLAFSQDTGSHSFTIVTYLDKTSESQFLWVKDHMVVWDIEWTKNMKLGEEYLEF